MNSPARQFEDDVDTTPVSPIADLFHEIERPRVHHMTDAVGLKCRPFAAAGGGEYVGSCQLRQLDRGKTHATAGRVNQDPFPCSEISQLVQGVIAPSGSDGQPRRFFEAQTPWLRSHADGRHGDELSEAAGCYGHHGIADPEVIDVRSDVPPLPPSIPLRALRRDRMATGPAHLETSWKMSPVAARADSDFPRPWRTGGRLTPAADSPASPMWESSSGRVRRLGSAGYSRLVRYRLDSDASSERHIATPSRKAIWLSPDGCQISANSVAAASSADDARIIHGVGIIRGLGMRGTGRSTEA